MRIVEIIGGRLRVYNCVSGIPGYWIDVDQESGCINLPATSDISADVAESLVRAINAAVRMAKGGKP